MEHCLLRNIFARSFLNSRSSAATGLANPLFILNLAEINCKNCPYSAEHTDRGESQIQPQAGFALTLHQELRVAVHVLLLLLKGWTGSGKTSVLDAY